MKLAYRLQGKGETILFIHGFCENKDLWQAFEQKLSAGYQTLSLDLPGFGESTDNRNYESIDAMAREIRKLLGDLQIERCVVSGHSLGGYVALALADLFPELITKRRNTAGIKRRILSKRKELTRFWRILFRPYFSLDGSRNWLPGWKLTCK
jgi:pimeloyl-ACP methyl ester carboxylesterase